MEAVQEKRGGMGGRGRVLAGVIAVVAVTLKASALSLSHSRSEMLGGDPYGTLARSVSEGNGGRGVLARTVGGRAANVEGALGQLRSSALAMGGDLSGAGMGSDSSWQETGPESAYPGGFLFDRSLAKSHGDVAFLRHQGGVKQAHGRHREAMREVVDGSLASLPSSDAASGGVLSVTGGDDGRGTLAHMAAANPDGVLAIYGHTGEYVERKRLAKEEKHLKALEDMEKQARAMHQTQVKRLKALEAQQEQQEVAGKAAKAASEAKRSDFTARPRPEAHKAAAAAKKQAAAPAVAARKKVVAAPRAIAAAVSANKPAAAAGVRVAVKAPSLSLSKLGEAAADEAKEEEEEEEEEEKDEDIGWTKKEWGAGSWVLFFIFGPVATVAICGLVWHCAGIIPALVMLFMLFCLDLTSYYYSWYLV